MRLAHLAPCLVLAACASGPTVEDRLADWHGQDEWLLVARWGKPDQTATTSAGTRLVTYHLTKLTTRRPIGGRTAPDCQDAPETDIHTDDCRTARLARRDVCLVAFEYDSTGRVLSTGTFGPCRRAAVPPVVFQADG